MKKLILISHCSFFIFHCSLTRAACPPGFTEVDGGPVYIFNATACPAGSYEISTPIILPSPVGGNDAKGAFTYGVCNYQ